MKNVAERTEEKVEDAIDSVKEKLQQLTWLGGGRVARKGVPGLLAPRVAGEGLVGSP